MSSTFDAVSTWLRELPASEQLATAIELGKLVLPFATLADAGVDVAEEASVISSPDSDLIAIEHARHRLYSVPAMQAEDEPEGLAWFAHGTLVAWIYVADAATTAPSDGVHSTFLRVVELLDAADADLGDTDLADQLVAGLDPASGSTVGGLAARVVDAVARLKLSDDD